MVTPIPAFVSQVFATSADTVTVTTGTTQTLTTSHWYYLVSNRGAATDGRSLLLEVVDKLNASLAGTTWTIALSASNYRAQISHNNGSPRTVTLGTALATALGFSSASFAVANGVTVTAAYPSYWWWTPNMPVSMTGPTMFDPAVNYGIPSSAGSAQRSSDMTAAYVSNGTQYEAEYIFNGVDGYQKIRPQSGYTNQDFETWWRFGPQLGRRMLMWRDRNNATGSNAPSEGSASPYNYVEYNPQPELRAAPLVEPLAEANLAWWRVRMPLWVTEAGETPMSD